MTWAWYAGAYKLALADGTRPVDEKRTVIYNKKTGSPNFQAHHQPFNYHARFAPGSPDRDIHLLDEIDFLSAIDNGTLPSVSYFKPAGVHTQHPAYTNLEAGDEHVDQILKKLKTSKQWEHMLIVVTYDENGGYWDHVPPPRGAGWSDEFGPGTRVPAILIGPHVKRGFIDQTVYDTTSILQFITKRYLLTPLKGVRQYMGDFSNALE